MKLTKQPPLDSKGNRQIKTKEIIKINSLESKTEILSNEELKNKTIEFKQRYQNGETLDQLLPEAFAVVREANKRIFNKRLYDVQLLGGIALHRGKIAEMKTGEGKTLTLSLPAYLNALSGESVHVFTTNSYLAKRDAEEMGRVYGFLGLTTGLILNGMTTRQKQEAYRQDIVYGVGSEFGFDYLRNNIAQDLQDYTIQKLNFAIIDEADSVMIDDARTPLILSGKSGQTVDLFKKGAEVAALLTRGEKQIKTKFQLASEEAALKNEQDDYLVERDQFIYLTDRGSKRIEEFFKDVTLPNPESKFHIMQNALHAKELKKKDKDYVVENGEVKLVDQSTGRIMEGRRFMNGLHQAIEAKEQVEIKSSGVTSATISLQKFLSLYKKLSGMTGTGKTEHIEFKEVYGLDVEEIPTNKPIKRIDEEDVLFATKQEKYAKILEEVQTLYGQPILIGVSTIKQSEELYQYLTEHDIQSIAVLNAKNHEKEASIIAQAGRIDAITIATNMAGRGTDIMLGGNPEFLVIEDLKKEGFNQDTILAAANNVDTLSNEDDEAKKCHERYKELFSMYNAICTREKNMVLKLGGLYVLGAERNNARRVDNQLRGRSGRQGDIGKSKFIISLEDDWLKEFSVFFDRFNLKKLNNKNEPSQYEPVGELPSRIIKEVNQMQKRIEVQSYDSRKNLVDFDEINNIIRQRVYTLRNNILEQKDLGEKPDKFDTLINDGIQYIADFTYEQYKHPDEHLKETIQSISLDELFTTMITQTYHLPEINEELSIVYSQEQDEKMRFIQTLHYLYPVRLKGIERKYLGREIRKTDVLANMLITTIDTLWEHLLIELDKEKESALLSNFGIKKPLQIYQNKVELLDVAFWKNVKLILANTFFTQSNPVAEENFLNEIRSKIHSVNETEKASLVLKQLELLT